MEVWVVVELFVTRYGKISKEGVSEVGMECSVASVEGSLSNFSDDF